MSLSAVTTTRNFHLWADGTETYIAFGAETLHLFRTLFARFQVDAESASELLLGNWSNAAKDRAAQKRFQPTATREPVSWEKE